MVNEIYKKRYNHYYNLQLMYNGLYFSNDWDCHVPMIDPYNSNRDAHWEFTTKKKKHFIIITTKKTFLIVILLIANILVGNTHTFFIMTHYISFIKCN